jgi:pimeloyl-ACP methyl ester carboxylesterase
MQLPTVVFIHGALNDHSVWTAQSRTFSGQGYPVLAPDLPGHGRAEAPLASVPAMAGWLLAQLDHAGVQQAALVGHSMGSLIALEAAAKAPQLVTHLAMLGSTYPMKVAGALLDTALSEQARAIDMVTRWSHAPGYSDTDTLRQLMRRLAEANPLALLHNDLAACNGYDQGEAAAQAVRCPTLLIFGASDVMTPPASAARLAGSIAQARTVTLESGHAMMAEQPDAVSRALLDFIGNR